MVSVDSIVDQFKFSNDSFEFWMELISEGSVNFLNILNPKCDYLKGSEFWNDKHSDMLNKLNKV